VTTHRMAVVNGIYPGFGGPPMTAARADAIVRKIPKGVDVLATCETGAHGCATIAEALGENWSYQRAQGTTAREGLNGVFWDQRAWDWQDKRAHDWTLPSAGQWPRTLLLVRLAEVADPTAFVWAGAFHLAAKGSPLTAAAADRVKWIQSHKLVELIGDRRALIGGDFPRTGDDDDMRYLNSQGWTFNGRTDRTPLTTLKHGAVKVGGTTFVDGGALLDHDIQVTTFTVASATPAK
jgi:hypothetical protein